MRDVGQYWGIPGIWAIFLGMGIVSIASGVMASNPRDILIALGAIGVIAGVLMTLVTPRHFIRPSLLERIHGVLTSNVALHYPHIAHQNEYLYIPCDEQDPGEGSVLIFVPAEKEPVDSPTEVGACPSIGQVDEDTLLYTTGDALLAEYSNEALSELSSSPTELARQTIDGLENGLELVESASCAVEPSEQQATIEVKGVLVDVNGQFDDPITSFIGAAFASGLDQPIIAESSESEGGTIAISCRWENKAWQDDEGSQMRESTASLLPEDR